jgi:hypothetical protein
MLYLRIIDEQIHYPYTLEMLKSAYPNISFPDIMDDKLLADFDVFYVQETPSPESDLTNKVVELDPINIDGQWKQQWDIVSKKPHEIITDKDQKQYEIRNKRDELLSNSDWIVISSLEKGKTISQDWIDYRQDLRDIPTQKGFPYDVIWPIKPLTEV